MSVERERDLSVHSFVVNALYWVITNLTDKSFSESPIFSKRTSGVAKKIVFLSPIFQLVCK